MTRSLKKRCITLAKSRNANGIFTAENRNETNFKEEIREIEDFLEEDWGDDNDSEWEEDIDLTLSEANYKRLLKLELIWKKDAHLEKKTRRPYLTGSTKKSTFYDNYGPKIEILTEDDGWNFKGVEVKIEDLKEELRRDQYKMSVIEYNKKRAIFEMLKRIKFKENEKGLIKASVEAAELVFIESRLYKARCIRVWAKYWLQHFQLPPTFQGKHQKIIRLVDDEDVVAKCQA
ncbi:hypothetical protein RhiirA1_467453 [Rhizophagus irregularis]|uniref:Uncharacterized protein n=2 Tax=Rhizophagus irregularis TaxID=588596 RepID=A0A2N0RC35_9GLOM|nr:hypothetical protein RirG_175360 [Rhizophagus irregularis DAOM 197198w]PKC60858.1 hypothetical protein RhiirA1_467453 [Rhizophagus irregularis]UZO14802.1 hypothetical protein OCT59_006246 [Rhizophagus irregularis]